MNKEDTGKTQSIEDAFLQIEDMIRQMENPEVSLDESFALYQKGIGKLKECNAMLDKVEKQMQVLNEDGTLASY